MVRRLRSEPPAIIPVPHLVEGRARRAPVGNTVYSSVSLLGSAIYVRYSPVSVIPHELGPVAHLRQSPPGCACPFRCFCIALKPFRSTDACSLVSAPSGQQSNVVQLKGHFLSVLHLFQVGFFQQANSVSNVRKNASSSSSSLFYQRLLRTSSDTSPSPYHRWHQSIDKRFRAFPRVYPYRTALRGIRRIT